DDARRRRRRRGLEPATGPPEGPRGAVDVLELSDDEDELSDESDDGELSGLEVDSEEDGSEDESSDAEDDEPAAPSAAAAGPPVKLSVTTGLSSSLLDQALEFAASRTRTVESLRQAVRRGRDAARDALGRHRPPGGRQVRDRAGREGVGDEHRRAARGLLPQHGGDAVRPGDAVEGERGLRGVLAGGGKAAGDDEDPDEDADADDDIVNHSLNIRRRAAVLRARLERSLPEDTLRLLREEAERVDEEGDGATLGLVSREALESAARRNGRGRSVRGGAAMNVKRALQRNLNVNWADTTRNALLFLFFGYFGGRSAFSRAFLLLSAPLCFLIQTRPVKVAMKQLFYTAGEPPGILLSLLPAPQQAIMSCDYAGIMVDLYGEDALEGEEWFEMDRAAREGRAVGEEVDTDDDDVEEYDVYDSDEEY
ncbi:hypothetical protein THAOC_31580, partial [Thalassiosira oceanica]